MLTAAGRVSRTGWARSPLLSWLGPLPPGSPFGAGGRIPAAEPASCVRGPSEGRQGRPWSRDPSQAYQPGGQGAAALLSLPSLSPPSSQTGRGGGGVGAAPRQERVWAIHRKANNRSKMRASSRLRPSEAAGVTTPGTHAPPGGPGPGGRLSRLPFRRLAKGS